MPAGAGRPGQGGALVSYALRLLRPSPGRWLAALVAAALAAWGCPWGARGPAARASAGDAAQAPAQAPAQWRGLWLDNGTMARLGGREPIARLMAQLAQAGFNVVLVEALFRGYTLYPGPFQDPRFADWPEDPLQVAVEEARRQGLQVHGWMWALGGGIHGEFGPILRAHPQWADRRRDGSPFSVTPSAMPWLDPSRAEVRAFLAAQAAELATRYRLDGIHLDYIRYSDDTADPFGYSPHAVAAFAAAHGIQLQGRGPEELSADERALWHRWREDQVTAVVAAVREALRERAPGVQLSAAVAPELGVARRLFLQDWRRWLADGLVDLVIPMAYTSSLANLRDVLAALEADLQALEPWRDPQALRSRVVMGLGLFTTTPQGLVEQVVAAQEATAGVALFAAAYLSLPVRRALAEGPFRQPSPVPPLAGSPLARLAPVPWQPPEPQEAPAPTLAELTNLAPSAQVLVDSTFRGYSAAPLTDGVRHPGSEVGRWAEVAWASAERPGEHWVELRWPQAVSVRRVDVYWALDRGRFFPSRRLVLQVEGPDGGWQDVWELQWVQVTHAVAATSVTIAPVSTRAVRLLQPAGGGPPGRPDLMWVAEIEVYG